MTAKVPNLMAAERAQAIAAEALERLKDKMRITVIQRINQKIHGQATKGGRGCHLSFVPTSQDPFPIDLLEDIEAALATSGYVTQRHCHEDKVMALAVSWKPGAKAGDDIETAAKAEKV